MLIPVFSCSTNMANGVRMCITFMIVCCRINKKIPRGPPSPPAPVMHSPSRKVEFALKNVDILLLGLSDVC